ncbi:MAG: RNA-guided endonuclease InsQ/TnpB family protein [Candidatus Asgardarchaeia archaeon]
MMEMETTKTIRCKLIGLTKRKLELLNREYDNFQHYLKGEDRGVYSATKQQGKRTYRKIKPDKEYPLVIRKDLMDIRKTDNKLAKYWARIPIHGVRGGIKVALAHQPFYFEEWESCGSKLVRKNGEFYLHVTVKKDIELRKEYSSIIAIDLGARWVAVSVARHRNTPKFYGKRVREVRGKYFWLRRQIGKKKKRLVIKKIGNKEKRIVNDELRKIAKEIVDEAERHNAIIAVGNLNGIRKNNKGRKVNRKINSMPFYRLKEYIKYKALERGIAVIEVPEFNTSKQCSRCGSMNTKRPSQGVFICEGCGYRINADVNRPKTC